MLNATYFLPFPIRDEKKTEMRVNQNHVLGLPTDSAGAERQKICSLYGELYWIISMMDVEDEARNGRYMHGNKLNRNQINIRNPAKIT